MSLIWNQKRETMKEDEKAALQGGLLRDAVRRAYEKVAPYRKKMEEAGVHPDDIRTIEDIRKLPFTTKQDLRDSYPYGMLAVPMKDIVRVHASSGTMGKQTVVGYTQKDVQLWSECMARSLYMSGVTGEDVIQVAYGYGLFTGGLGGHYGGETIGAATIPASAGNTRRQLQMLEDFGTTVLLCTPSYATLLGDAVREAGLRGKLKLRVGVHGAEPWTEDIRNKIEASLGIRAHDIYGLSELCGPGVANDCMARTGLHIQEDHFFPEVVDKDTGAPLPDGAPGELVFTCLTKEAMPLIRYNTRDIAYLRHGDCACGRTTVRMGKVTGRTDDMLIIRGVNVFPSQVESVLLRIADVAPYYLIVVERQGNLDTMEVQVEMTEAFFFDEVRRIEEMERHIYREMESALGVSAKIRLVTPKTLERSEGKAKRVIDKRKF